MQFTTNTTWIIWEDSETHKELKIISTLWARAIIITTPNVTLKVCPTHNTECIGQTNYRITEREKALDHHHLLAFCWNWNPKNEDLKATSQNVLPFNNHHLAWSFVLCVLRIASWTLITLLHTAGSQFSDFSIFQMCAYSASDLNIFNPHLIIMVMIYTL